MRDNYSHWGAYSAGWYTNHPVAWHAATRALVGDNRDEVIETGLYNLTKDEAPALVHLGKDKTEQRLLVRLKNENPQAQNDQ